MTLHERMREIIANAPSVENLTAFARTLKSEGHTQTDVMSLFDGFRSLHESDSDETIYNTLLDVMDLITGYCPRDQAIFADDRTEMP